MEKRAAINEAISAWFEPKPPVFSNMDTDVSPKGVWVYRYQIDLNKPPDEQVKGWQPLDYFTDEAANARLLEAMPRGSINHRDDRDAGGEQVWECNANGFLSGLIVKHADRKTAVVMEFCKFAGIEL